jgi:hypothetical protein
MCPSSKYRAVFDRVVFKKRLYIRALVGGSVVVLVTLVPFTVKVTLPELIATLIGTILVAGLTPIGV